MNILEMVYSLVGDSASKQIAAKFGLSQATVDAGLKQTLATLLSGIALKRSDADITNKLGQAAAEVDRLGGLDSMLKGLPFFNADDSSPLSGAVNGVLSLLFGGKVNQVVSSLASSVGVAPEAASHLLQQGVVLLTGFFGERAKSGNVNLRQLVDQVGHERSAFTALLPAGLVSWFAPPAAPTIQSRQEPAKKKSLWPWIVLLVVLILLALFGLRGCGSKDGDTSTSAVQESSSATTADNSSGNILSDAVDSVTAVLGSFFKLPLPDGVELNVPEFGIENKLVQFIKDDSKPVDDTTWFSFDRLTFETNSNKLMPGSEEQIKNIAAIMKAFPKVHLKLGGYTDNTGTPEGNLALSNDRAQTVMQELINLGVEPNRLEAKGYGQEHPVASNDTDEGRAKNRRIDVNVTAK